MIENLISITAGKKPQPAHWHDNYAEINFIIRGRAVGMANNELLELKEGELWVVNREVVHSLESCSEDCVFLQMSINMEQFNPYIPNIWTVYFKCGPQENDNVSENLKSEIRVQICKIVSLMDGDIWSDQQENEVLYACIDMLNTLKLGFNLIGKKPGEFQSDEQFDRIWRIADYIYDNCNRKLTLKEVAEKEHMSEAYLSRMLKTETGKNFEESLAHIRAECSIKYLLESSMSITSIAYECGFSAPRYYNAAFQKYYNCTPAAYRKKVKSSFKKHSEVSSAAVIYEEGLQKAAVLPLLGKYNKYVSLAWEVKQIDIDLDTVFEEQSCVNPYNVDTVQCSAEDLLSYENLHFFKRCREELRIKAVWIKEWDSKTNLKQAEENARFLGFICTRQVEKKLEFTRLYAGGVPRIEYVRQKIFNDINPPHVIIKESAVLYKDHDAMKLILFNHNRSKSIKFNIQFRGDQSALPYFMKKEWVRGLSEKEEAWMKSRALSDLAGDIINSKKETQAVKQLREIMIEESIARGQICLISLIPVR